MRAPQPHVFDQLVHSSMSCGPAALATAIASEGGAAAERIIEMADDAVAFAVEEYGERPSANDAELARFKPDSGVNPSDLLAWTNEWRADLGLEPRVNAYLERFVGESEVAHTARVHRALVDALAAGAVPMVRLRCFAPGWYADRNAYLWDGVASHWVAIMGVPRELEPDALGFPFAYADPAGGRFEQGFVAAELERDFVAARGDVEHWTWLEDRPFLLVHAPRLDTVGRGNVIWFLRANVTFDHALLPAAAVDDWDEARARYARSARADAEAADGVEL